MSFIHTVRAYVRQTVNVSIAMGALLVSRSAWSQGAPPAGHEDAAFDLMNLLTKHGLHDIDDESWNAYGQSTYISSWKLPFHAAYTNLNGSNKSLLPVAERSFTATFTLFFGVRLWPGAEAYFVPEVVAEHPFSGLSGLGASIQNFELQKTGSTTPQMYRSRTYLRQTFNLGGTRTDQESNPMQLGNTVDGRRIVLTVGTYSFLDIFDRNDITWDPRQTFLNMAFMTHASWDFAADARGYSFGAGAEFYWDMWTLRIGRMAAPQQPNVLPIDLNIFKYYADALELEHDHILFGQAGALRLLGYRNYEVTGDFDDAMAAFAHDPSKNAAACLSADLYNYGSTNPNAPDLCWVRKTQSKVGAGINVEQHITSDIGLFLRAMISDGKTEVDAFDSADRDLSFGTVAKGNLWHRPFDVTGAGFASAWISPPHARYLKMGGVDAFVGDGDLRQAAESVMDFFYSANLLKAIWVTADYQHIWNPGFNADRGPVNIFGGRVHVEF